MSTFIMLTRILPNSAVSPQTLEQLEKAAMKQIRAECPDVEWLHSYAALGPYDYVDIFNAPDIETAAKVSMLIRAYGNGRCEVWPATEWGRFKEMIRGMPHAA